MIEVKDLTKYYEKNSQVPAVNRINFNIQQGEILGVVGESGCGKSTLGKLLLNFIKPTNGCVYYEGKAISYLNFKNMRPLRKDIQMIFQNEGELFNPYHTVRKILFEPLYNFFPKTTTREKEELAIDMLERVGLDKQFMNHYGQSLSGGEQQRLGIARALIIQPKFVVCDEIVSSVDYMVRNKMLKLLLDFKKEMGLTYLFISHDLSVIKKICDRVLVMYKGEIVEILPTPNSTIGHPYTQLLYNSVLSIDPRKRGGNK